MCVHTHVHALTHIHTLTHVHTRTHPLSHTCKCAHTDTHTHTRTCTLMHACTHTRSLSHTQTCTLLHTHAHTHMHKHTYIWSGKGKALSWGSQSVHCTAESGLVPTLQGDSWGPGQPHPGMVIDSAYWLLWSLRREVHCYTPGNPPASDGGGRLPQGGGRASFRFALLQFRICFVRRLHCLLLAGASSSSYM